MVDNWKTWTSLGFWWKRLHWAFVVRILKHKLLLTWSYMFCASVLYVLLCSKWSKVWMKPSIKRRDQNHMFGQNVRYFVQIIKLGKKGFSGWHANVKQKISLKPRPFSLFQLYICSIVHRILGSCGFQWCGFHSCALSKNSPNIQLMQFTLHKWRNSFTHAFLVTIDLSAADLAPVDFCQT